MKCFIYKVSEQMCTNAFKRRLAFRFMISAKNNFLPLLKPFITTALEYKAILKL